MFLEIIATKAINTKDFGLLDSLSLCLLYQRRKIQSVLLKEKNKKSVCRSRAELFALTGDRKNDIICYTK